MAQIILGSYMVRYPLGGVLSSSLQWLVGFQRLGHDVYLVEKSGWSGSCYDPSKDVMSDDCSYGTATLHSLLSRFGLEKKWCFVDATGQYHGLPHSQIEQLFRSADLFVDRGTHGAWLSEAAAARLRVLVDGEPAATQMKMQKRLATGERLPEYDYYFTVGRNIGTERSPSPTGGKKWRPIYHPIVVDLFPSSMASLDAPFTTVANWRAHEPISFQGTTYGQKDAEFDKFIDLPRRTKAACQLAVAGKGVPRTRLTEAGWSLRDAHDTTRTFDSYRGYIEKSKGEFSVAKNVFVATNSGWFSDRSAAYLASARPVVLQETGFSEHLPCGEGLFAVKNVDEAAAALDAVESDYARHADAARQIAREHLDARRVLGDFLSELGV